MRGEDFRLFDPKLATLPNLMRHGNWQGCSSSSSYYWFKLLHECARKTQDNLSQWICIVVQSLFYFIPQPSQVGLAEVVLKSTPAPVLWPQNHPQFARKCFSLPNDNNYTLTCSGLSCLQILQVCMFNYCMRPTLFFCNALIQSPHSYSWQLPVPLLKQIYLTCIADTYTYISPSSNIQS